MTTFPENTKKYNVRKGHMSNTYMKALAEIHAKATDSLESGDFATRRRLAIWHHWLEIWIGVWGAMNLAERVTETLGSVDSFSVAASAAAVAEAAYLTPGAAARVRVRVSKILEGQFSALPPPNFAIKKVIS